MNEIIVIGSGPAGISSSKALIEKNKKVLLIDVGFEIENDFREMKNKLSKKEPGNWSSEDKKLVLDSINFNLQGADTKKLYCSDFASKKNFFSNIEMINCKPYVSYAKGGLSNLWGRSIDKYNNKDFEKWPKKIKNLDFYYKKILKFMDISIWNFNNKNSHFFEKSRNNYYLSKQSEYLIGKYKKNYEFLNKKGISLKSNVIAGSFNDCKYCGMCLYGCYYDILYTTVDTINELEKESNFNYLSGYTVTEIIEEKSKKNIRIQAINNKTSEVEVFISNKVYLAAGAISSTKIIMESNKIYNKQITIKTSDLYYIPGLTLKNIKNIKDEMLFTLSQLSLNIQDTKISKKPINIYIHGYNNLFEKVFNNKDFLKVILFKLLNLILGRVVVLFNYIHSDYSSILQLELLNNKLILKGVENKKSKLINFKIKIKLLKSIFKTGIIPIFFLNKKRPIGSSSHLGSSFPMSDNPKYLESDIYGRVCGYKNIHIVDSSVLPNIPSISHTFTIMANAYRIAYETCNEK